MTVTLKFPDGSVGSYPSGITGDKLRCHFGEESQAMVAVRINNELCSLSQPIDINASLAAVFLGTNDGSAVYRRSLCFLLAAAAHRLFPGKRLLVGHSLGYGYYYTLDTGTKIKQEDIQKLHAAMCEIVEADTPIRQKVISYEDALELFDESNQPETRKQLSFICPPRITVNTIGDFSDLYFAPLTQSAGILTVFDLVPYGEGFLLRFPATSCPDRLPEFEDIPQLFAVYRHYKKWGKTLGVTSAASLNELINRRDIKNFIDIAETLQNKCVADIADQIQERQGIRVVLIAGPSSSGKTTTSKKLSMQLSVLGYKPKVIELDTYYVGRENTPKDENGEYDYECLEALDVELLNRNLVDLFAGKQIELPSYNFKTGTRYYTGKTLRLEEGSILVLEGIHGLNDRLTPLVKPEHKFKIYLSALTQLNLDDHNRIPTSDNRLIRRIVRDSRFRGKSAADTIKMWPNVQKGERTHIFPFQNNADTMFNTALDYELSVLKVYAEPLLRCVSPLQTEYAEASRLLRFLNNFSPIPASFVPGQSLLREFIGDSEFKY